ncbi:hypothetical protein BGW37DRAFT_428046 [Umbelopsis sp. PMI_123]|nr:hypothetical protein BGW37DRAFT_428046 [Umbelopsis sp. PMI_123]
MSLDLDTLSFILLGSISTVALLSIRNAKGPDVHPLLLNAQADPSRLRHIGETAIYRSRMHPNGSPLMLTVDRNIRTLHDLFEYGGEVKRRVDDFRCGLATFANLTPKTNDAASFVGIFSKSSAAANSHSYIAIPIAASARTTFISHVLSATSLTTVIVDKETLPILLSVAEGSSVKYVIVNGTPSSAELASAKEKNIQLEEFKNIEYIGEAHPIDPVVPEPDDICSIYFTKTSGKVSHHTSYIAIMPPNQKVTSADRLMYSYPLGNVLSRVLTGVVSYVGGSIAYGSEIPEDEDVVDITRLQTCAQLAMPTIIASGSLAFKQIKDRIESHYGNSFLYKRGYETKKRTLINEGRLVVDNRYDMLVFRDIRQKTFGGSLRLVLFDDNGDLGELPTFVRVVLGAQAVPTYSQTEASGTITASMFFDYSANPTARGSPTPCNEVKLIDLPDEGYLAEDQPNPRGEICVRGNNVFSGYWGDSNTTSEVLDGDKWFMTGEIGEWLPNGTLKIVGSKK